MTLTMCHTTAELRAAILIFLIVGVAIGMLIAWGASWNAGRRYERRRIARLHGGVWPQGEPDTVRAAWDHRWQQ